MNTDSRSRCLAVTAFAFILLFLAQLLSTSTRAMEYVLPEEAEVPSQYLYGDHAEFIAQCDRPKVTFGEAFEIWFEVQNTGSTTWNSANGYYLHNLNGESLGAPSTIYFDAPVSPGATYRWTIAMQAPEVEGDYWTQWMIEHNGSRFGPNMNNTILVRQDSQPTEDTDSSFSMPTSGYIGYYVYGTDVPGYGLHGGIDICADQYCGDTTPPGVVPVYAAHGGTIKVFYDKDFNITSAENAVVVVMEHSDLGLEGFPGSIYAWYLHLGHELCVGESAALACTVKSYVEPSLEEGVYYPRGTLLGYQGDIGLSGAASSAVHLHFELRDQFTSIPGVLQGSYDPGLLMGDYVNTPHTQVWPDTAADPTSTDWQSLGFDGDGVLSIAHSPDFATDGTVFLGTDTNIMRSTNWGRDWSSLSINGVGPFFALAVSPEFVKDRIVFAGDWGIKRSTDGGDSWAIVCHPEIGFHSIALSPEFASDRTVFAGTADGHIWRSQDAGSPGSWVDLGLILEGFEIQGLEVAPRCGGSGLKVFAGLRKPWAWTSGGVYVSIDSGDTWSASNTGLDYREIHSMVISSDYCQDETLFVTAWSGGVYRSTNGGQNWTQVVTGNPNRRPEALGISPAYAQDKTLYLGTWGGAADGGVYRSQDGGDSWGRISGGLGNMWLHCVEPSPRGVLAGGEEANGGGLWYLAAAPAEIPAGIDRAAFVGQSYYPTVFPDESLQIWFEVENTGSSTWTNEGGYSLVNINGESLGASSSFALDHPVAPGETYRWTIDMVAPPHPGLVRTQWMIEHSGERFGPNMYIDVTTVECVAPSGLNVCSLEPGDILLVNSPGWTGPEVASAVGGSYWVHAGLYVGGGSVIESLAQGVTQTNLVNGSFWGEDCDWAVLRPTCDSTTKMAAIAYAEQQLHAAYNCDYLFMGLGQPSPLQEMINKDSGQVVCCHTPLDSRDTDECFYCTQLVWRAYELQGIDLDSNVHFVGTHWSALREAITGDDLYYSRIFGRTTLVGERREWMDGQMVQRVILKLMCPADLMVVDPSGRRAGADAVSGQVYDEIPGVYYSGRGEHQYLTVQSMIGEWRTLVSGNATGAYTLCASLIDSVAPISAEYTGTTGHGETTEFVVSAISLTSELMLNAVPSVNAGGPYTVTEGSSVLLEAVASDLDGADLAYAWDLDCDGEYDDATGPTPVFDAAMIDGSVSIVVALLVTDADGAVDTDTAEITVSNVAPMAMDDGAQASEDGPAIVVDVLANDSDPAGANDPLTVMSVDMSGTMGEATLEGGAISYDPAGAFEHLAQGAAEIDQFGYTIDDGDGGQDSATVLVTVVGANDAPTLSVDAAEVVVDEGQQAINSGTWSDVDNGEIVTLSASVGEVVDDGDGTWSWSWATDDGPSESRVVTITADDGVEAASVQFDLGVVNAAPTASMVADQHEINEGDIATLRLIEAYDPSDADTSAGFAYSYDCDGDGAWDEENLATDVYGCLYPQDGEYWLAARIQDKDGDGRDYAVMVTVNNVCPVVGPIQTPIEPLELSTDVTASAIFTDLGILDQHIATWDWGDGIVEDVVVNEAAGSGEVLGSHTYAEPGVYRIVLTVSDEACSVETEFEYVVIYDPEGGFVTGGGWIMSPEGAYTANPTLTGKATFGFVSKYKKGATVPTGQTQFQFKAGDLNFHSDSYQWLVVAGAKAKYKGVGTINGAGNYGFMISAIDASLTPSTDVDLFRIKIWDKDAGDEIVYDNQLGAEEGADPTTALGGGSIVVHKTN